MDQRRARFLAPGSALLLSSLTGAAAIAGSSHSVHNNAEGELLQQQCRTLMATFDREIGRVPDTDAARQARRLRTAAERDCFSLDASVDNVNFGVNEAAQALAKIGFDPDRSP